MSEGTIAAYNLGKTGVVVDKSLVHAEDGELSQAQNAIHDKHGSDGGICNREGLLKHHAVAAAGSILGFVGAPLGPGPGAGTDDATVYYTANTAGTWFTSSNSFSTSTTVSTLAASGFAVINATLNGRLYYASGTTIRVFDGVKDALFSNVLETIINVDVLDSQIYVSTDSGFVYAVDSVGRLLQIGTVLPSSYKPNDLILHQNDLYAVCTKGGSVSTVYRIRLSTATTTTAWTLDFSSVETNTAMKMASFSDGLLYLATNTSTTTASIVYRRSTAGSYSAVDTGGVSSGADSIIVYQGRLYVHWDHSSGLDSTIRRSSDGTTWATVLTYTPVGDAGGIAYLFSTGSKLFAIGHPQTIGHYSATGAAASWVQFTAASALNPVLGFFKASGPGASFGASGAFELIQGSSSLQILNQAGTLNTLTLPTGVTLDTTRPPRFAIFDRYIVVVNTPSRPITVDAEGITRVLTPLPPVRAISLDDDGGAGALTGAYLARQTYLILDAAGNIISESDFSPVMETAFVAAADTLDAEGINISPEQITGNRIYRTTAGGTTYFPWIDVDGNTLTQSVSDDQSDASLSLVAAPILGTPPNASLIATWRGRLWAVDRAAVDHARYSETGQMWSWPSSNDILIGREGADVRGITAIMARRDALGFGRRETLNQITGTSERDFRSVVLTENCGVESQETVVIYKDTAYFLWKDGVYTWDSSGIKCISDTKVRTWFVSNSYFNRERFQYAFASIDPVRNKYCLFLASAGSSVEDRWVEYDLDEKTWWGPHKTDAFTPVSAGISYSAADRSLRLTGSASGFLWKGQTTRTDDLDTPIEFDVDTKRHDGGTPKIDKVWLDLVVSLVPQTGGVLTILPFVGELNALGASRDLQAELVESSFNVGRLGLGKSAKLKFYHMVAGQLVQILGYEIDMHEAGQR